MPNFPTLDAWLFSIKTFAAAMLALFIAFRMNLDRPYWAMTTAYIVAQPLTGAMRSKAIYRFFGTLIGAAATVVLVPNLANSAELLSLALALWTGLCLYLALLDRTPRSYVFMLSGYTAALIGFPSVADPGSVFDTAVNRVEEITLGIICATVIGSIAFPRFVGPVLSQRLGTWFSDVRQWCLSVLEGQAGDEARQHARRRLAADAAELDMLASHLAYDRSNLEHATRPIRALRRRMVMGLPVLSAIGDRMRELQRTQEGIGPHLRTILNDITDWVCAGDPSPAEASRLRRKLTAAEPPLNAGSSWRDIVLTSLLLRLKELLAIASDSRELRQAIETGRAPPRRLIGPEPTDAAHRDHAMALLSAAAAALAVLLCCAFWIATGWPEGAVAAEMAAVACCFFAAQDDPAPFIVSFVIFAIGAVAIDIMYLFVILPAINSFEMLALVLAPVYLVLGVLIATPATFCAGMPLAVNGAALLSLQATYSGDLPAFLGGAIAFVLGMSVAAVTTRLIRS
ncbi:MAG: FUSC family protein, partial [Acetobacteraceae bacterium]|nr:FUSC family protein [Acetobacteraceae bacterium]